jgi:hypothetical protein
VKRSWWTSEDETEWQEARSHYLDGYTSLENLILLDDSLTPREKMHLLALRLFDFKKDGVVWPSLKWLGRILQEDYRNVSATMNDLARRGYIVIEKENGRTGPHNVYRFARVCGSTKSRVCGSTKGISQSKEAEDDPPTLSIELVVAAGAGGRSRQTVSEETQ